MANRDNYLFALSFIAKDESGLALVSAPNATTAFQILKNSGRYNYGPEFYILIRSRNLGLYTCRCAELLLESYTNAEVAYEKFVSIADSFVGPAGESAGFGSVVATVDDSTGVPYVEVSVSGPDTAKNFSFSFHNLKGQDGSDADVTAQNIQSALGYVPVAPADISQFITKTVDDLTNYYLKSETYTKAEVEALVAGISGVSFVVANSLPTASASTMGKIYLIPSADPQTQNVKDEFITLESGGSYSWEQIGSTAIDLDGYVTDAELQAAIAAKQDVISDLATIRSGAAAGATAYQKPSGGIPSTDMASAVQTSLGKADSAYQKPNSGIPKTDLASGIQSSLDLADSAVQAEPVGSVTPAVTPYDYATREEVSQLEAKVTDIEEEFAGYEPRTATGETSVEIDGLPTKTQSAVLALATRNILLLPYDNVTSGVPSYDYSPLTVNGMTITPNRDGSLKLNGTATATITLWLRSYHISNAQTTRLFLNGTYTISINAPGAGANVRLNATDFSFAYNGHPSTHTYAQETMVAITLAIINGFTANNLYIYPQIEAGSSATPFQTPLTKSIDQSETPTFPDTDVVVSQGADTEFTIENGSGTIELSGRSRAVVTSEYPFTLSLSYTGTSGDVLEMAKKAFSSAVGESVQSGFSTTFNSNDSISLISTMAKKNKTLTFFATIGTMGSIRFLHGEEVYNSGDVTIDGTNIVVRTYGTSYTERLNVAHGLTMKDYIAVTLLVGDTNNLSIVIRTNGGTYTRDNVYFGVSNGDVSVKAIFGSYSNASVSWVCDSFRFPVWMFGDSYLDTQNAARWPKYIVDAGFPKFFASGYPGATSSSVITDFRESVKHGNPKYLLWALGMNDADNGGINQSWLECVQEVISTCETMGIVPILATIPNCPTINHTYKNAWVKASGYRYVDFAEAVGASSFPSSWYDDMLSTDNVHPLNPGAIALAYKALADMPELTRCK